MISSSGKALVKTKRLATRRSGAPLPYALRWYLTEARDRVLDDPASAQHVLTPEGDVPRQEMIRFPSSESGKSTVMESTTPVLLNSKEHAVGYLSKILNARVYDAAIETELQEAKNLSTVCL